MHFLLNKLHYLPCVNNLLEKKEMSSKPAQGKQAKPKKLKGRQGDLSEVDKRILWGRAGGRCQRCNSDLGIDASGWRPYNLSENAHIVASSINGTRGNTSQSAELADKIDNHLLLCQPCHKVIDDKFGEKLFPVEALLKLKHDQEALVSRLMDLAKKTQSVAVFICASVGAHRLQPLVVNDINMAIVNAGLVPATRHPIHINLLSLLECDILDSDPAFWETARKKLQRDLEAKILECTHLKLNEVEHFSVFGIAPIPVLALLGSIIPDTRNAMPFEPYYEILNPGKASLQDEIQLEIHQFDRDISSWSWPKQRTLPEPYFKFDIPDASNAAISSTDVAILFELSFPAHESLVRDVMAESPTYKFYVDQPDPNIIQSHDDLKNFMRQLRSILNSIERTHGHETHIHVFGSLPVSCAIAIGRVRVKGSLPMTIYNLLKNPTRYVAGAVLSDN